MNDIKLNSDVPDTQVANRFKLMTAEQKLILTLKLYDCSKELKRSWLKMQNKTWTNQQVDDKLKEIFLYART